MSNIFEKIDDKGIIPTKGTSGSAGYDLYAAEDVKVVGGDGMVLVPTSICGKFPEGTYGSIRPRSGLAFKQHISVGGGVIDRDYYPKPIGVLLYCTKIGHEYTVKRGERCAQLIIEKIVDYDSNDSSVTVTRNGGFGSTGK